MSVIIYTYRDPYKLKENKELWKEISSCPYFCAAQTLVNGLKVVYGAAFQIGRVTTVKNLTDVLYEKWNGTACAVKQHADIDNIIVNSSDITGISRIELDNVKKSFLFNRDEVFTSIRTMFELKMEPQNIVDKYLTPEQRFIVSVYKKIRASEKVKDFCLEQDFTEEQINKAIIKAMTTAKDNSSTKNEIEVETLDHIVIHGVHQFSPLLLRAIEEIAKYKKVILLINYQEQYKNIYQTWIDIYSAFDCEIQNFDGIKDNDSLEALHQLYTAKGGDAVEKRQETLKKRADLMAELSNVEDRLHELMADALPMLLVEDLVVEIKLQATDEHTDSIMQEAVLQLDNIFEDFAVEYLGDKKAGIDFIEYVKKHTEDNQIETVYGLSEQALFQTNNLVEGVLKNTADETKIIIKKKKKLVKQISEFDSYLMLDINDKELKNIHKKIKAAEQAIIDDQVKIAELEQRRGAANSRVMTATSEFGKYVEAYLSTAELKDSSDRIIKYSNIALNVIEKYRIELQKRKTNILAATITDCYLKLANKKNLIQTIVMDPESLDLRYLSENGAEVPKDSLSAGEQQLMVISILWALALCSKKKLPVIN